MGLEDELSRQEKAVQAQKAAEAARAEAEAADRIREQIIPLSEQRERLASLLNELQVGYESVAGAQQDFKAERQVLSQLFDKYQDTLSAQGIASIGGMSEAAQYRDQDQVKSYQEKGRTRREKVQQLSATKKVLREEMKMPGLSFTGSQAAGEEKSARAKAIDTVQVKIDTLDQQIWELHIQTPEGEQEKADKDEFVTDMETSISRVPVDYFGTRGFQLVTSGHLKLARRYGRDHKDGKQYVMGEYTRQLDARVDTDIVEKMRTEHKLGKLTSDIEAIQALRSQYSEASRVLRELDEQYEKTVSVLTEKLGNDADLKQQLKRGGGDVSDQRVAAEHINYLLSNTFFSLRTASVSERDNLNRRLEEAGEVVQQAESLMHGMRSDTIKIPDSIPSADQFQDIQERAKILQEYLSGLETNIREDSALLQDTDSTYVVGQEYSRERRETQPSEISNELRTMLGKEPFRDVEERIQTMGSEIVLRGDIEKELIRANIEQAWRKQEQREYEVEKKNVHAIEQKHAELEQDAGATAKAQEELGRTNTERLHVTLEHRLDDQVVIERDHDYDNENVWKIESVQLNKELARADEKFQTAKGAVDSIEEQIRAKQQEKEEVRWPGKQKKMDAIDEEITVLNKSKQEKEEERNDA